MLNAQYGQIAIEKDELVTSNIYTDSTLQTIDDNMLDLLRQVFIQNVVTESTSDNNNCEIKMNTISFMTSRRTTGFFPMTKI